jgi:hypothetical protein
MDPPRPIAAHVSCPEARRILSLPRHVPVDGAQIDALSAYCRLRERNDEGRVNRLRPQQVQFIRDMYELPGVFADMPVGSGKTLPLMLAPFVLRSERSWMLLPADLFRTSDKTQRDFARYRKDWRVLLPELRSYEEMARKDRANDLMLAAPDLLLADEADPLRNPRNAVTRRVRRYRAANLRAKFAFASGTLITNQLMDYAHLSAWTLAQHSPAPLGEERAHQWAEALDGRTLVPPHVPGLASIPGGFHTWFRNSRGIVSGRGEECPQPIRIQTWSPTIPDELQRLIDETAVSGLRPDGELLDELGLPTVLCSLSCGLYHVWDPLPPEWWLSPRRNYLSWVRETLELMIPGLDTQAQIEDVLDGGAATDPWGQPLPLPPGASKGRAMLAAWRAVKRHFEPNSVPVWVDRSRVTEMIERAEARHWLLWCPWVALGHEYERQGIPYYHEGRNPELAKGETIAVAQKATLRGKNLQKHYHKNLVPHPSPTMRVHEQLIGRTHRSGQEKPVTIVYRTAIDYHGQALGRAYAQALELEVNKKTPNKLTLADWI